MDAILGVVGGVASTVFAIDLIRDHRRSPRPHVAAYAAGILMFAIATWAFVYGTTVGWNGIAYRTFFLFGAILNIPVLALGSMFLVVGRRSGHVMTVVVGAIAAISITLTTTVPFVNPLPATGVPSAIFPPITDGFGPRLLAAIAGGTGALLLIVLSLVSLFRFWRTNRRIVIGNALILAGTLVASFQGTVLALEEEGAFALKLTVTATLLWLGYRVTKGARFADPPRPRVVLLGPSTTSDARRHADHTIALLEEAGYEVFCPARDLESWGEVGRSPADLAKETFRAIDTAAVVLADLRDGYGIVMAGYAAAKRVPVVVASPQGRGIPRPLRGIAVMEIYYDTAHQLARRLSDAVPPTGTARRTPARR
ncbi:MAG TPA: hypothetical protein VMS74_16005 [Acidimicrobiia bacterium]|nr:hypothetical protein [Acidimicrobiia bacterium]